MAGIVVCKRSDIRTIFAEYEAETFSSCPLNVQRTITYGRELVAASSSLMPVRVESAEI